MKSVLAILAMALTFSGVMAAPAACPKKDTSAATYASYGSYKDAKLPEHYGKYDSYGTYKDAKLPEHYGSYDKYGSYKRDGEAKE